MSDSRPGIALHLYRVIVWALVAVSAVLLVTQPLPAFPAAPDGGRALNVTQDWAKLLKTARSDADSNNIRADTAPKQQVVNGWLTNDQLEIIGLQNAELSERLLIAQFTHDQAVESQRAQWEWEMQDRRLELLVLIFGLGVAAHLAGSAVISLVTATRRNRRSTPTVDDDLPGAPGGVPVPGTPTDIPSALPAPLIQPQAGPAPMAPTQGQGPDQWPTRPPVDFV
ncbi:hypothetical protein G7085_10925 [Tessaracoccus sp. HDW20]|uniref:hypothetical protein n=1 Tax=Tessaracoccus coleopterorum TaxID=2714950 RepID=UPI0018D2879C|nr:hypothetical protein [Tessaracoccus coleopterorum]NHB84948.1 hypothetical protein [Tessaracoccus coleopterorum]